MGIVSALLVINYLIRSYRHINSRLNWFFALLLLLLFLTSTYDITYLQFLLSFDFSNLEFNSFDNIIKNWFSGGPSSLALIGILFLVIKNSLFRISEILYVELFIVSISTSILLIKTLLPINYLPIVISIFAANFIHIFKNKNVLNFFKFKDTKTLKYYLRNKKNNLNLIFSFLFLTYSILVNFRIGDLKIMSEYHIYRIIFVLFILLFSAFTNSLYSRKFFNSILPVSLIYLGLILSSIVNSAPSQILINKNLSLESLTSIAFFPVIEIVITKYHLIGYYQNITNNLKLNRNLFRYIVNITMIFITSSYLIFLFTQ